MSSSTASVAETMKAINKACRGRGRKYAGYSCAVVSWDDVSRGEVGGQLSCWGANITDTYLKSKDGEQLFTVRPDNWNEKLGKVSSNEVALVAGNHVAGGGTLSPVTLRDFIKGLGEHGAYAGLPSDADLSNESLDAECSIRFQTTFLPVSGEFGTLEFATEAYNYNTMSDEDPRNLVLLCTSQGVAVQQDGEGAKRLYHHAVDEDGAIHRYWLEAERSKHKVGGAQKETDEERADASRRGKATASVIGTRAMGTRFNVLMTIQVPLEQEVQDMKSCGGGAAAGAGCAMLECNSDSDEPEEEGFDDLFCEATSGCRAESDSDDCSRSASSCAKGAMLECAALRPAGACSRVTGASKGVANAARVSRGSQFDVWSGLSVAAPKRNAGEHVTLTVVIYNTIAGGVPTEEDVVAAIDDLEDLYEKCGTQGRLADQAFDFMKKDLTAKDMADITHKVTTQPYKPPPAEVANFNVFPS
mmetsp:Transcript_9183/g.17549  ORF Transcript_9183/g.17549 Transcript_9183/m.17549 type:complete len:473 (+) Transcript_9183:54-1472(+)